MTCTHCGATLKLDEDNKSVSCPYCGASLLIDDEVQHIQYDNAEEAGYQFEKGRQRARAEAYKQYSQSVQPSRKRRTGLWVLGWIFLFPLPLTILLVRKKNMNPVLKFGIIAVAWVLYVILSIVGGASS